jgi:3-deoxy-manno-octulosonate cytidylyltransferase (CMP-KDO synthetase)
MAIIGIIPARYESSRFPGKPLADIAGRPMVQHVYERACRAKQLDEVLVATDDRRIYDAVRAFGGEAVMTDSAHATGTDRLAEVARKLDATTIVVNIQGDEPLLDPATVDAVIAPLLEDDTIPMSSVMVPMPDLTRAQDPNVVKVVTDQQGFALYFSRAPIPIVRDPRHDHGPWRRHIGLYAYRRDFLLTFASLPPTPLEEVEKLEQLRALEHGYRIKMVEMDDAYSIGVDTPDDLERVRSVVESFICR